MGVWLCCDYTDYALIRVSIEIEKEYLLCSLQQA
jgi:hypothetical protein